MYASVIDQPWTASTKATAAQLARYNHNLQHLAEHSETLEEEIRRENYLGAEAAGWQDLPQIVLAAYLFL